MMFVICSVPDVPRAPDHPPEAVHAVAFVLVQLSVVPPPGATVVGLAEKESVGACAACNVTVVDALLSPDAFEHVSTNVVVAVIAGVAWLPESALLPVQPPEAVHDCALVVDQVSVLVCPLVTAVGLALIWTDGRLAVADAG